MRSPILDYGCIADNDRGSDLWWWGRWWWGDGDATLFNFTIVHNGGVLDVVAIAILLGFVAVSICTTYGGNESLLLVAVGKLGT